MRSTRPFLVLALTALIATMLVAPAAAKGGPPPGAGPNPDWIIPEQDVFLTDEDGNFILDDDDEKILVAKAPAQLAADLEAADVADEVQTVVGEIAGAAYVGQAPEDWNGERLIVWAHGYRGEAEDNPYLTVDPPPLFQQLVADGDAWIASSYRRNSYDPGIGIIDTKNVTMRAQQLFGKAEFTYVAGVSMGGHVIGAAIEKYPDLYDGALPACGVMGDVELFDYFLDYNLGAAAIANQAPGVDIDVVYPDTNWVGDEVVQIKDALSDGGFPSWAYQGTLNPFIPPPAPLSSVLTDQGVAFRSFVEIGSGGERTQPSFFPGVDLYDIAWDYWHLFADSSGDFFFDLGEGDGTIAGRAGIVSQNSDMSYADEYGTAFASLDDSITRVTASNRVRNAQGSKPAPIINGTPGIPVLTMHTIGDLFVPIEMQQIYAREVEANGLEDNLVQRAIRDVGHCTFSDSEWDQAYFDLFRWVEDGDEIEGEDLLADIDDPNLGLEWTISDGSGQARGGVRAFLPFAVP